MELARGHECVKLSTKTIEVTADDSSPVFTFDRVFGPSSTQQDVFEYAAMPVVQDVLLGYNATIFAYGQTSSGKTFTMEGPSIYDAEMRGLIPRTVSALFDGVLDAESHIEFTVKISYIEIYMEKIQDLLDEFRAKGNLQVREDPQKGIYVAGATEKYVTSEEELLEVMTLGARNRAVAATGMNEGSSRSHSVFIITVQQRDLEVNSSKTGMLYLVDLAGSEMVRKTGASGHQLEEAKTINKSLSALGQVINALTDDRASHVPYRDSKLTRLLQDSLGGNTKTVMCANCGPAEYNYDETVTTLRYANRAKNIKNKPKINEDPKDAMLREFQEEIKRLKAQLEAAGGAGGGGAPSTMVIDGQEVQVPVGAQVIEKIVEKEVIREVNKGATEEELARLRGEAEAEKQRLKKKAAEEMKKLLDDHSKTAEERKALEDRLNAEQEQREKMEAQKQALVAKMNQMKQKLIVGGEMMDKAAKQEAQLRRAKLALEERAEREQELAQELAEKEEERLRLDEQYSSLQDEVEDKTNKLKKLWTKYQTATREVQDIQEEFQAEREDMLDTIRQLSRQLKLKELLLENFVPPEDSAKLERRARWDDDHDAWFVPRLDLAGNQVRPLRRPVSSAGLRRPETEYARQRQQFDGAPRYRQENVVGLELDMPERTTQDYEGPNMVSRVQPALAMGLDAEDEEVRFSAGPSAELPAPYLQYNPEDGGGGGGGDGATTAPSTRPKTGTKKGKSRPKTGRPSTASRRRRQSNAGAIGGEPEAEIEFATKEAGHYPKAKGLMGR